MTGRLEVVAGSGTVIRYGAVIAWAGADASPALLSFLAQSARNLAESGIGGRLIADHIAGVLATRDPEPHVPFATLGPSEHGWAALLHGPVQCWDGTLWLAPTPSPGWLRAIVVPQPAVTVTAAGSATPALQPNSVLDLERGTVPGAGFVFLPSLPGPPGSLVKQTVVLPAGAPPGPSSPPQPTAPGPTAQPAPPLSHPRGLSGEAETTLLKAQAPGSSGEAETTLLEAQAPGSSGEAETTLLEAQAQAEPQQASNPGDALPTATLGTLTGAAARLVDLSKAEARSASALPPVTEEPPSRPGQPVLAGARCSRGHFNHPKAAICWWCAGAVDPIAQSSGPRPALGVLVVDDGGIYRLDGSFVIGAAPEADRAVLSGAARPLPLPGEGVVASHANIRLEGWKVLLLDRGSERGTFVVEPGANSWTAVASGREVALRPGTHIAFGQRVVTFVSPWPE